MKEKDEISKGPKRRDETCYQVLNNIVIPAGTILRATKPDIFKAKIDSIGEFSIFVEPGDPIPEGFRKVVA